MVDAISVAEVLGLRPRSVRSLIDLRHKVSQGLPKASVRRVAEQATSNRREAVEIMHRIIPEATYKRRKDRLSAAESERTERIARVVAAAEYVWDDPGSAKRFLAAPHPELGGETPLQASLTELGARHVEEILTGILHGLPA